jgi:hypothetical protein
VEFPQGSICLEFDLCNAVSPIRKVEPDRSIIFQLKMSHAVMSQPHAGSQEKLQLKLTGSFLIAPLKGAVVSVWSIGGIVTGWGFASRSL